MIVKDFRHCMEIITALEESGIAKNNIDIKLKAEIAWDTHNIPLVQEILDEYPGIYEEALRNIDEITAWEEREPFRPYPEGEDVEKLMGKIEFGTNIIGNDRFGFDPVDFTQILGAYGVPKTGKTWFNTLILRNIFKMPKRNFNVIIVDRKLDYIHLIKENPKLIILGTEDIRFNQFEEKEGWLDAVQVVSDENYLQASSQPILEEAYQSCLIKNGLLQNGRFTNSDNFPNYSQILEKALNITGKLKGGHYRDIESKIYSRFRQYIRTGDVFNCKKGYPLDFWINNDIIITPDGINKTCLRSFIIGLVNRIFQHFRRNNMRGDDLKLLIVLDEGGWLLDADRDKEIFISNDALNDILRMGREFGIGWIFGAQQPNMVCKTVRENTRFLISFRVQSNSMDEVQKDFGLTDAQRDYMKHELPPKLTGVFSTPNFPRPVLFKLDDSLHIEKNVKKEWLNEKMRPIIDNLKLKISEPAAQDNLYEIRKIIHPDTIMILRMLQKEPFTPRTELFNKAGLSMKKFDTSINWLIKNNLISTVSCKTSKKRTSLFYPITEKGHDLLNTPLLKRKPATKLFKHSLYCQKVKECLQKKGFEAVTEYSQKGVSSFMAKSEDGKTMEIPQRIDVFAIEDGKKTAYEITISNFVNLNLTIYKCIAKMGMDELFIVCENKAGIEKAKRIVSTSEMPGQVKEKVKYKQISDFF